MKTLFTAIVLLSVVSATTATGQPISANNVHYRSATGLRTTSGTPTINVQEALDSLSSSVARLIGGSHSSTWSGEVSDVFTGSLRKTVITLTFHPTSATAGTWTSTPLDAFSPSEVLGGAAPPEGVSGNWSGTYTIVGDAVLASDVTNPNSETLTFGRSSLALARGSAIELIDTFSLPFAVTILHKAH